MARIKEQNVKCEEAVEEKGGAECVEWVLPHQHVGHILTYLPFKAGNFRNETHIPSNFYFSLQREECTSLDAHCIMNEFRVLLLQKQSWKVELFAKHGTAVSFSVSRSSPDSDSRLSLIPSSASYSSQSPPPQLPQKLCSSRYFPIHTIFTLFRYIYNHNQVSKRHRQV